MSEGWLHLDDIPGGVVVFCTLCGRKRTRRTFLAANTNHAEARRLATAYHWQHEHSEPHKTALSVFHEDPPEVSKEEQLLREIFGTAIPNDKERRRSAARRAARRAAKQ